MFKPVFIATVTFAFALIGLWVGPKDHPRSDDEAMKRMLYVLIGAGAGLGLSIVTLKKCGFGDDPLVPQLTAQKPKIDPTHWYYRRNGEEVGPCHTFTISQLIKGGEIDPWSLIRPEGGDWSRASDQFPFQRQPNLPGLDDD